MFIENVIKMISWDIWWNGYNVSSDFGESDMCVFYYSILELVISNGVGRDNY